MLTLTLLRHAKSDWDDESLDDFDRPLAPRGKKAAPVIGQALKQLGSAVELVLCSPALRARQTLDLVLKELNPGTPDVVYVDGLYHGLPDHLLEQVIKHADTAGHVLLVGHNPGLEILAAHLARGGSRDDIAALNTKFPTAALAQFTFSCTAWTDIPDVSGQLIHFLTPRSLA